MGRLNMSDTPDLKEVSKLNLLRIKNDGQYSLTNDIKGKLNPNLNFSSKKENQRMEDKSIVNNKPSQFGPILGVNFHNIKK
ncbi:MAG: hypothetical protein GX339_10255 [Tissierellia bacterium]|nr:hypothetical protein [Tissierellia bacterium]